MIYECTLIKCQQRLIILSSITKPSLIRLYKIDYKIDFKQLMVTNTANRPSHERENNQISSLPMNLNHMYSLVEFEPSGSVAQCQGLQDIWDICNHPGKLSHFKDDPLACWHTGSTSGMLAQ